MTQRRANSRRLDRRAWVSAGIEVLCSSGVHSVRVEALAKKLNVSKGSFYWHFKNREDLLDAILDEWQVRQSDWDARGDYARNPVERWTKLFDIFSEPRYGSLELALSAWARQDESVARRLAEADRRRVAYLSTIFREIGFSESQAAEWANSALLLYLGWIDRTMREEPASSASALAEILSRFVLAASALSGQEALQQSKR